MKISRKNSLISLQRLLVQKGGLKQFVKIAWHQVEPARPYIHNWHIDTICSHLEAVTRGDIT
jgi:hypothetical protein